VLDTKLLNEFALVAARAAYASSLLKGKGDKIAADQAAVDSMRNDLNKILMKLVYFKSNNFSLANNLK